MSDFTACLLCRQAAVRNGCVSPVRARTRLDHRVGDARRLIAIDLRWLRLGRANAFDEEMIGLLPSRTHNLQPYLIC